VPEGEPSFNDIRLVAVEVPVAGPGQALNPERLVKTGWQLHPDLRRITGFTRLGATPAGYIVRLN
jgi:hypothetical protein